ncbi:hypothetical protein SY83_10085 [Paenibacillus swuensis]|uniref:ABC transporter domain-containing protein n=1 Tax=Paenibacillus swuensis TaxID=1178515 RepID=A0A172TP72_9BACL|nr:hypothetical protein SY83_10085 [Paenibacillus swuensis]
MPVLSLLAVAPLFLSSYYTNILYMIGIYVMIAAGMNILIGYCGIVSIGHAGLMAVGAYVSAYFSNTYGLSFWVTGLIGVAAALLTGTLFAIPTLRAGGVYLSMVTIAFGIVINEILIRWDGFSGGPLGISGIAKPSALGYTFTLTSMYELVLVGALTALFILRNVRRSAWGRAMIAVKENEIAATSVGIKPFRVQYIAFALSSVLAGLAGAIYAHANSFISPDTFGFHMSVQLVLIVILGGAGTLLGPVIGALIIVMLPEVLELEKLRLALYGSIMFLVLYLLPKGIAGTGGAWVKRWVPLNRRLARTEELRGPITATTTLPETIIPKSTRTQTPRLSLDRLLPALQANAVTGKEAVLQVRGLNKSFGGLHVVKDVSFDVATGTVHTLVGPNGAGKTTVLNMISGFYPCDAGAVTLQARPLSGLSLQQIAAAGISRTFQHTRLFGELSVLENVMAAMADSFRPGLLAALARTGAARAHEADLAVRAHAYLDLVGYAGDRSEPATALPYGHQRMVEIARALAVQPRLLLLDEPAAGMTAGEIEHLENVISKLKSAGLSILLIEHHMDFVARVSDRVTVLDYGSIIAEGTPEEICRNPRVIQAYLGEEDDDA